MQKKQKNTFHIFLNKWKVGGQNQTPAIKYQGKNTPSKVRLGRGGGLPDPDGLKLQNDQARI